MKKLKILIPSLIATTSMPLVSMAACNNDNSKQWVVQFNTNGGSFIDTTRVEDGQYLDEPQEPERSGFRFAGWFKDEQLKNRYYFNEPVTENMTIYVAWEPTDAKLTLHFGTDGNGSIDKNTVDVVPGTKWSVLVASGELPKPTPIDKFEGWFIGNKELKPYDITPIDSEWFITAHFEHSISDNSAYIIDCPENISLSNTVVTVGQPFVTYINATDFIDASWVKNVINSGISIEQPSIEQISSKQLKLTVNDPQGDIAIVISSDISEYHSYICNKPEEGFKLISEASGSLLGIVQSPQTIDEVGAIKKIIVGERELEPDDYHYDIVDENPYQASIVLDEGTINGNVLIWMDPLVIDWHSTSGEPYPYPIIPLEPTVPPDEVVEKFYNWIESNKKNYINDLVCFSRYYSPTSLMKMYASDMDVTVDRETDIIYVSFNLDVATVNDVTTINYTKIEASNLMLALFPYDGVWGVISLTTLARLGYISDEVMHLALTSNENPWSFKITSAERGDVENIEMDNEMVASLTPEQWDEMKLQIYTYYEVATNNHLVYYLKDVPAPEAN